MCSLMPWAILEVSSLSLSFCPEEGGLESIHIVPVPFCSHGYFPLTRCLSEGLYSGDRELDSVSPHFLDTLARSKPGFGWRGFCVDAEGLSARWL